MILDGNKIANETIKELKEKKVPDKYLAVFVMEDDKKSFGFVNKKKEIAEKLGIDFVIHKISAKDDEESIKRQIGELAKEKGCGGIIVQLPLRGDLNEVEVLSVIPEEKDVDVLGKEALGSFYNGESLVNPPVVGVVETITEKLHFNISDKSVAVVGAGFLVGKPIANWLMGKAQEIFILDKGSDFKVLEKTDLVISGVGKAGVVRLELLKNGAGFIDFGYDSKGNKLKGDLDLSSGDIDKLSFYTPTPGGTGPILVSQIFKNFYKLNN